MGVPYETVKSEVEFYESVDDVDELIDLVTIELVRAGFEPEDLTKVAETVRTLRDPFHNL